MQFDYKTFHIDCRARHHEDGHYVARAKITVPAVGGGRVTTHDSGDIDSFVNESDAISCAKAWAIEWCDENWD